jgi:hypothetical protein
MDCFVAPLLAKTEDLRFNRVGFAKLSFRAATGRPGIQTGNNLTLAWRLEASARPPRRGAGRGTGGARHLGPCLRAETALRLGRAFGNSPEFWMRLQADYDLAVVERNVG